MSFNFTTNLKQIIMKNLFKKESTQMDFSSLSSILTSGAAAGMAIANYTGKNPKTGGIIGVGLSLLVTGLIIAMDDTIPNNNSNS
jgi:FtsH-binding integral membrane protein